MSQAGAASGTGGGGGGTGDVVGPASSVNNAIATFDGTTGKLIQNSIPLVTSTGEILAGLGTGSNPTFANTSNPSSGIYFPTPNQVGVLADGTIAQIYSAFSIQMFLFTAMAAFSWPITIPGAYPYNVSNPNDVMIPVDTTAARTINLPGSPIGGKVVIIKDDSGLALINNITIQGNGQNIDGSASAIINTNYGSMRLIYNGTQWNVF